MRFDGDIYMQIRIDWYKLLFRYIQQDFCICLASYKDFHFYSLDQPFESIHRIRFSIERCRKTIGHRYFPDYWISNTFTSILTMHYADVYAITQFLMKYFCVLGFIQEVVILTSSVVETLSKFSSIRHSGYYISMIHGNTNKLRSNLKIIVLVSL